MRRDLVIETKDIISTLESDKQKVVYSCDINIDIISRHVLPLLERMEKNDQDIFVNSLLVMQKIGLLKLDTKKFLYPEKGISKIREGIDVLYDRRNDKKSSIAFKGTTSKELQKVIDENPNTIIDIHSERIIISNPIVLRKDTQINGNMVQFESDGVEYGFLGENVSNVYIKDISIEGSINYGIYFINCNNIIVSSCRINSMLQKAICVIGTTSGLIINNNKMCSNQAGGLYIVGDVSNGIIESNEIKNNKGTSNWMAGMVLTNAMPLNKHNPFDNFDSFLHFPIRESMHSYLECPHELIIKNNIISDNNSSGIYADGAYMCCVLNNTICKNDKEGICLDFGTIGFYLRENIFDRNGQRIRQTDDDLKKDFVLDAGRMDDGSAKLKLPGVSLDNTAYDILENNIIINNYGGGIKMVRTAIRTLIIENIIKNNNIGQNDKSHYFGIEVGAAVADDKRTDMDFTPSYENIICRNIISGDHYSGVFIGEECYVNDVFDNVIMENRKFAIEAISQKFNSIVNNIPNANIRNEYQGN